MIHILKVVSYTHIHRSFVFNAYFALYVILSLWNVLRFVYYALLVMSCVS